MAKIKSEIPYEKAREREEIVLKLLHEGLSRTEIIQKTGISDGGIRHIIERLQENGLIPKEERQLLTEQAREREEIVLRHLAEGLSRMEIIKRTGISEGGFDHVVNRLRKKGSIPENIGPSRTHQARKREEIVLKYLNDGLSAKEIIQKSGISGGGVRGIIKRFQEKGLVPPGKKSRLQVAREREEMIQQYLDEGLSKVQIIQKTGISDTGVRHIFERLKKKESVIKDDQTSSGNKELLIIGQKSWHEEVRIIGNRDGLLALSDAIRKAATGESSESPVFFPPDGEGFNVVVDPIEDGRIGQYSSHYCDLHDPGKNLLPENISRAAVYAETVDGERVVRTFDDVKNGEPTSVRTRIDPNPDEADGMLMNLLMSDFGQKSDSSGKPRSGAFWKLVAITHALLDTHYPADIFTGESGDKGPGFIRRLRDALKGIEEMEEKTT